MQWVKLSDSSSTDLSVELLRMSGSASFVMTLTKVLPLATVLATNPA